QRQQVWQAQVRVRRPQPQIGPIRCPDNASSANKPKNRTATALFLSLLVFCVALLLAAIPSMPSLAQSGDAKADGKAPTSGPADGKEAPRRGDEFAEASRLVSGPAGNPECVWLGRRVVGLLW